MANKFSYSGDPKEAFSYKGKGYSPIQLQKGILGVESTLGTDRKPRYEPLYHESMKANPKWIPTRSEKRVIKDRGYEAATKEFSTSRGSYQILPETAYRYTSFVGEPEDLEDVGVEGQVWLELMKKWQEDSGGDLEGFVTRWNGGGNNQDYLRKLVPWMQ